MKKISLFNYSTVMFFIIRSCFVGMSLNTMLFFSKNNSYISVILGIIVGLLIVILYDKISMLYPNKNIYEMIDCSFNKVLSKIIKLILVIFAFLFSFIIFWNFINFISSQFLYKTPNLVIAIFFIIAIIYTCSKGYQAFFRSSTIIFYMTIILFLISFFALIIQSNINIALPFIQDGIKPVISGSYYYICFNILPLFLMLNIPRNKIENNKNLKKVKFIVFLFSSFTLFSVIYLVLTIYGINLSKLLQYPEFHLLKRISIFGFIERTEDILSLQWAFDYYIILTFLMFFIGDYFKTNKKNILYIIIGIIFVISSTFLFPSNTFGDNFIKNILPHLIFIIFLFLPIIIYIRKELHDM